MIGFTMDRIRVATPESRIAVFKETGGSRLYSFFADTIVGRRTVADKVTYHQGYRSSSVRYHLVGVYDNTMDKSQIRHDIAKAILA